MSERTDVRAPTWEASPRGESKSAAPHHHYHHHQLFLLFTKSAAPGYCPPPLVGALTTFMMFLSYSVTKKLLTGLCIDWTLALQFDHCCVCVTR